MATKAGTKRATNSEAASDKREAILRSATKVFAQNGYFNSKVADIAAEAGIADGTVYLYFKSKDEILHSIFDRAMEHFIAESVTSAVSQDARHTVYLSIDCVFDGLTIFFYFD